MMSRTPQPKSRDYDVCLSFAGEDRRYVEAAAKKLLSAGLRVFYDKYETINLWGKDLYQHLDDVYQNAATYCVLFVSRHYARKLWTNHERKSAQARAFKENSEYILPVRLDRSSVPGLPETVGYVDAKTTLPNTLASLIVQKVGAPERSFYLPPLPDRLHTAMCASTKEDRRLVSFEANAFVSAMRRMTEEERLLVYEVFDNGCPGHLPKAIHISLDLLHRVTGFPRSRVLRVLAGMESLGFHCQARPTTRNDHHRSSRSDTIVKFGFTVNLVEFADLSDKPYSTDVAAAMIHVIREHNCDACGRKLFMRGDFSPLCSVTAVAEKHRVSQRRRKTSGGTRPHRRA